MRHASLAPAKSSSWKETHDAPSLLPPAFSERAPARCASATRDSFGLSRVEMAVSFAIAAFVLAIFCG